MDMSEISAFALAYSYSGMRVTAIDLGIMCGVLAGLLLIVCGLFIWMAHP